MSKQIEQTIKGCSYYIIGENYPRASSRISKKTLHQVVRQWHYRNAAGGNVQNTVNYRPTDPAPTDPYNKNLRAPTPCHPP